MKSYILISIYRNPSKDSQTLVFDTESQGAEEFDHIIKDIMIHEGGITSISEENYSSPAHVTIMNGIRGNPNMKKWFPIPTMERSLKGEFIGCVKIFIND